MKKKMGVKGPSSRKGDPDWKYRKLAIEKGPDTRPRNTRLIAIPSDIQKQNKLAEEMIEWAGENKHLFSMNKFPLSKGYNPWKFFNIAKENEYFKEALSFARYIVMDGMLEKNLDEPTAFTVSKYRNHLEWWDKHYAEHNNAMIERRKKNDPISLTGFTVIHDKVASSPRVPEKKIEDES